MEAYFETTSVNNLNAPKSSKNLIDESISVETKETFTSHHSEHDSESTYSFLHNVHPADNSFASLFGIKPKLTLNRELTSNIVVCGHRGGFKPDNCLLTFKIAKENKLPMVELDVSLFSILWLFMKLIPNNPHFFFTHFNTLGLAH